MVQTYKQYVEAYASLGLANKAALEYVFGKMDNRPLRPFEMFVLDAIAYVNPNVGTIITVCDNVPDQDNCYWQGYVSDSVAAAKLLWHVKGYDWSESDVQDCTRDVDSYVYNCFRARLVGLYSTNEKYRSRLYAAMARAGMSRVTAREHLKDVLAFMKPTHTADEFTDDMLDDLVTLYQRNPRWH